MNIKEVKELIQEILRSDISEFELEHTGTKVKLRRGQNGAAGAVASPAVVTVETVPETVRSAAPAGASAEEERANGLHYITSPIVGTFYRAPSPGAEPFVKIGAAVDEGTTLCIVEAMKLMNEIPSDVAGEVAEIYVDNSHPVEFGQRLFGIRVRK